MPHTALEKSPHPSISLLYTFSRSFTLSTCTNTKKKQQLNQQSRRKEAKEMVEEELPSYHVATARFDLPIEEKKPYCVSFE